MPFSAVASYSSNKGSDMFVQGYEQLGSDFFDQFITYTATDDEASEYSLPDSVFLKSSENSPALVSQSSHDDEDRFMAGQDSLQGASWATEDSAVASHSAEHVYGSERSANSENDLLSLEDIHLSPRISLSPSPAQPNQILRRRNRIVESLSKTFQKGSATLDKSVLRSPIRKAQSNPAMMRTIRHQNSNLDLWGKQLDLEAEKFNFDFEQNDAPLSLQSSRAPMLRHIQSHEPQKGELINGHSYKRTLTQHASRSTIYDSPLTTPTLGHYPSRQTSRSDNALFPVTPQSQNASSSWSQLPGSPNFNAHGNSSMYPEIESPLWWNHASTAPMAQPSPNIIQINAQRSSKSLASQFQNDSAYDGNDVVYSGSDIANGLMIQMPDNSAQQPFIMDSSPMPAPQTYFRTSHCQPHKHHQHSRQASYHARPRQQQNTQYTTPTRKSRSDSRSNDSESPSPQPAAFQVRKRKTPKSGKSSTPKTPTSGSVDFVNYTPSDSRKILTGVAPSGSSKTKARREKEADDKRRKLSQAAMRAVRAAGGDVDSLVEQGLFV